jgi:serine/threonine-protein kinase
VEPPKVGELIDDKYILERQLGQGGMGTVFAAKHRMLGDRVALKVMLDVGEATDEVRQRFMNEARLATRINSPHVARPRDSGFWQGLPYIAMELMEGEDLEQSLERRGPLPIEEAVDVVLEIADALTKAHAEQIVHRDIKTANIFLAQKKDGSVTAKLLDFGISKAPPGIGSPSLTRTSSVMGSPNYMSPEQLKSSKDVDPRTDVWSLAVVLHEILTGHSPFPGESFAQIFMSIVSGQIPDIRSRRSDCPEVIDEAVAACLVRDRNQRTSTVAELASSIAAFGTSRSLVALRRIRGQDPDADAHDGGGGAGDPERTVMAKAELVDALRNKGDPDRTVIAVDGKLDEPPDSDRTMLAAPSSTSTPMVPSASAQGIEAFPAPPPFGAFGAPEGWEPEGGDDDAEGEELPKPPDSDRTMFSAQASPYAADPRIQAPAGGAAPAAPGAGLLPAPGPAPAPTSVVVSQGGANPLASTQIGPPPSQRMRAPSIPDVAPPSHRAPSPSFHSAGQLPVAPPAGQGAGPAWSQGPLPPPRAPYVSQPLMTAGNVAPSDTAGAGGQALAPLASGQGGPKKQNPLLLVAIGAAAFVVVLVVVGVLLFLRARH